MITIGSSYFVNTNKHVIVLYIIVFLNKTIYALPINRLKSFMPFNGAFIYRLIDILEFFLFEVLT